MKIYDCPTTCPAPKPDYKNYDSKKAQRDEDDHAQSLKAWLKTEGYTGSRTGEIVSFPVADGYAQYMLGDGRKSCLIHLPYGDAWQYRDAAFLPKAEILRRIDSQSKIRRMFA